MAKSTFSYPELLAQADDISACAINLSPLSIAFLLAVVGDMDDLSNWTGVGDELTEAESDEIDAAVAQLEDEIMTSLDLGDLAFQDAPLLLAKGGTEADNAADARANLGLGTLAEQDADDVAITGGTLDVTTATTDALNVINPTTHSVAEHQANHATTGDVVIRLDTATARLRNIQFRTNHLNRFNIVVSDAESGSNQGSNLKIQSYPDAGTPATTILQITRNTGDVLFNTAVKHIGSIGFYNTAPIAKPTVTGSRGGNAAVASLLTALANLGLITDSSTA